MPFTATQWLLLFFACFVVGPMGSAASEASLSNSLRWSTPQPPPLPPHYIASGSIRLPYAEINEPFLAYVDNERNLSRVDYYGGLARSYQFGNGSHNGFLLHTVSDETELNRRDCIKFGGVVAAQNVVPSLADYVFSGTAVVNGIQCNSFVNKTVIGGRLNTYVMHVNSQTSLPVKFEMFGYDGLFGSHYDTYYIDYAVFDVSRRPTDADFGVEAATGACHEFPTASAALHARPEADPLAELVHRRHDHVTRHFERFKRQHRPTGYAGGSAEEARRRGHFQQTLRFVASRNRAGLSYRLAVNHLADLSAAERSGRTRCRVPARGRRLLRASGLPAKPRVTPPASWDWRIAGAVMPVKDQGICGSCWSFGTTGAVEGALFVKTGQRVRLSQQQLVDCSWGYGNNGCNGGDDIPSYSYIQKHGLASEAEYGQYLMQDGRCHAPNVTASVRLAGFSKVPSGNETALKLALFQHGPVSVAIDASHLSFAFYSTGVYYEPACSSRELDHAVLAVGYGSLNGKAYWLVKNSWSTHWGNNGYVLMAAKDNNCGVMTSPTLPIVA